MQQYPKGALYVVATPIGNLADLTLRAIHVLALVDSVACEDTRVAGQLLQHLGLHKPLLAVHEHNEREAASEVLLRLQRGERVAYLSDAGTPAVSDPGAKLVAVLNEAQVRCIPIVGASAVAAALCVAGDAQGAGGHRFVGFLPPKAVARRSALQGLLKDPVSLVIYESPHRIEALALDVAALAPSRTLTVARELTKQFESVATMAAAALPAWLATDPNRCRGEFVLVLHTSAAPPDTGDDANDALLDALLAVLPLKQAVATAVAATGVARNTLYARALSRPRGE